MRREGDAKIDKFFYDTGVFSLTPADRTTEGTRNIVRANTDEFLVLRRVRITNSGLDVPCREKQIQGRLSQWISRQSTDSLNDTLSPSLKRFSKFVRPQDVAAICLDEIFVLVEPVRVQLANKV